jgi:predicted O-methyltransferase YrrM
VAAILDHDARVVEFGSGMSTLWLARRAGFVLSVEDDAGWHDAVQAKLSRHRLGNVRLELRGERDYADLSGFPDRYFDFALVDGSARHDCVVAALAKLKPGGWLYLDNTDKDMTRPGGDLRRAEAALLDAVDASGGDVRTFVDFAPGNFFVEQGMLARLGRPIES